MTTFAAVLYMRQAARCSPSAGRSRCKSVVQFTVRATGSEMLEVPEPEDARGAIAVRSLLPLC